ncbi:MAG: cell division transport system permease protein [Halieaceae bacterium]|jgi:cell division transport system permease protein
MLKRQRLQRRTETVVRKDHGASQARTGISLRLQAWLRHHQTMAHDSLRRLLSTPWASLMTWAVIGIALALPVGMAVVLDGADSLSRNWDSGEQLSVFLKREISESESEDLAETLRQRADVARIKLVSRDQALSEFQAFSGFGDALRNLDENPLPSLLLVTPLVGGSDVVAIGELADALALVSGVDRVVVDMEWVRRLRTLMELGRRSVLVLGGLLTLGVLLVIGNTIRLTIEGRRDEIVVIKLVGGSDAFVRRPFLYTGIWYGFGGALMAWILVGASLWGLRGPLTTLAVQYQSFALAPELGLIRGLQLLLFGATLGLLGAWVTLARHLAVIEPR